MCNKTGSDLISRSALLKEMRVSGRAAYMIVQDAPAVDAVEVVRCKSCILWNGQHIEIHPHSIEHPEQQAEFAECRVWSTWSTCFMTRSDDYCSQAKRRDDDGVQ